MIFNIIILVLVILLLIHLYKKNRLYFIFLLPFIVQYLWMFVSICFIENGVYVSEQDRDGVFVFANLYLLLYFIVSLVSFLFFFQIFRKSLKIEIPRVTILKLSEKKLLLWIAYFIMGVGIFNLVLSPSTYTSNEVTKFTFWNSAKLPILKFILGSTIGFLPFICGILFKRYKKPILFLTFWYVVYLVGIDQKFTAFLYGTISFMTAYFTINNLDTNSNLLSFKKRYLILIASLLFILVFIKYSNKNPYKHLGFTPVESIAYRTFGLQGHLFWGTSERYINKEKSRTWDFTELPYGMRVLMEDFTPENRKQYLEEAKERGVSWTNGYPAILNRILPLPLALIFHFFIFSIVPFTYVMLYKTLKRKNYLLAVVFFQIILWLVNIYSMSYFFRLSKIIFLLILISFIAYAFLKIKNEKFIAVKK